MDDHGRQAQRARYVRLCMVGRARGRTTLEAELDACHAQLDQLRLRLLNAAETLQLRPGGWLERWQRGRAVECQAEADFDALTALPHVAAIAPEAGARALLVTTTAGPHGRPAPLHLRLGLDDGSLALARADGRRVGRRARLDDARQAVLAATAAAHIGTGDLAGVVLLALGSSVLTREARSGPLADPAARLLYVRYRQRLLCSSHADDEALRSAEEALSQLGDVMARAARRACQVARCLRELEEGDDQSAEAYGLQFDVLSALPEVEAITVVRDTVRTVTRPLTVQHAGRDYTLGRFQIDILPPRKLQILNLDHPVLANGGRRYEHPHVANGDPCAGNMAGFFMTRLAAHEIPAVLQQAIALLLSYNPEQPFVRLESHWAPVSRAGAPAAQATG